LIICLEQSVNCLHVDGPADATADKFNYVNKCNYTARAIKVTNRLVCVFLHEMTPVWIFGIVAYLDSVSVKLAGEKFAVTPGGEHAVCCCLWLKVKVKLTEIGLFVHANTRR